jgi:coenzyme PQQ biosynthesis protein PqqD
MVPAEIQQLRRRERLLEQRVADALVLLDPDSGRYYALEGVGPRVWELLDGSRSVADVVAALSGEFDAPADTIRADVLELTDELVAEKLVVLAGETS